MRPIHRLLLAGGLALAPLTASGSLITLPGQYTLENTDNGPPGKFTAPAKGDRAPVAYIEYMGLTGQLTDQASNLHVEITLAGPTEGTTSTVGIVPLPVGTTADQIQLTIDGEAPEVRLLDTKQANALYGQLSKSLDSTRLLAYAGQPVLLIPTLPLKRSQAIDLKMRLPVGGEGGLNVLTAPLLHEGFTRAPAQRLTIALDMQAEAPLKGIFSPSHPLRVKRLGDTRARLTANMRNVDGGGDLKLFFAADEDPLGMRVLTHREGGEDHGYFMVLGQPSGAGLGAPIAKDLVLAIDTSGSMRGEKWNQVQAAALEVLDRLNLGDRFNLVAFGDDARAFQGAPVEATEARLAEARRFLEDLIPTGRTNIAGALALGLAHARKADAGRPQMLILLTDGAPTAGERDPAEILKMVPDLGGQRSRIFTFGVGHDVNTHLLDQMSKLTQGESHYVTEGEPIDVQMAALTDGLRKPVLTDVKVSWGKLEVDSVYPTVPTQLFAGREVLMVGRYAGGGEHTFTLSGDAAGEAKVFKLVASLPTKAQPKHEFLAPLWAARRIGDLLRQLRLDGADAEKVAEVVELSQRFGIFTEYTGFLAEGGVALDRGEANARATALMNNANMQASGAWAVRQADNEQALRGKKVSSSVANTYVDRRGRVKKAENLKQVGRRTFYKRDGRWVEAAPAKPSAAPKRKRRVKRFSQEYMDLVEQNKDFAKAQSLDGEIQMELGDEQVEVY